MYRGYSPTGEYEYQYLIRWEGYGPDDDTWEMRSALLDGANELVTEFDSQGRLITRNLTPDHPFFVTDCRVGPTPLYKKSYLVTFGVPPLHAEPSPLYQTLWTTKQELRKRRGITIEAAEMAVQLWHDPNYVAPPRRSTPRTTPRSTPQKQAPSTDVPAQQKRIEKPPIATPRRSTPRITPQRQARSPDVPVEPLLPRWNRKRTMPQRQARSPDVPVEPLLPRLNRKRTGRLLAVLDEYRAKPRPKSSSAQPRFLVKWEEDGDVKIEWMFRGPVQARFGKAEANAAIDSFRWVPEIKQEGESGQSNTDVR